MPKRRKYSTLTKSEIKALTNPLNWIAIIGAGLGIIVCCVAVSFSTWLEKTFGISSSTAINLTLFGVLVLIALVLASIVGIYIFITTERNKEIERKFRAIKIANIDLMTGIEFEHYLRLLLTHRGYDVRVTKASGDLGVDLIASDNNETIAIQAKRYDTKVSRRAISDAVAGMSHYGCNRAMVITNNYFTPDAVKLAQSTHCNLIDRDTLANWITEYQNTKP